LPWLLYRLITRKDRDGHWQGHIGKGNDTLESFLSKVAVESDFHKESWKCVMKTFVIFFFQNKLS